MSRSAEPTAARSTASARLVTWVVIAVILCGCAPGLPELARQRLEQEVKGFAGNHDRAIRLLYRKEGYRPIWMDGDQPRDITFRLLDRICDARLEGLDPDDYDLDAIEARILEAHDPDRPVEERVEASLKADFLLSSALLEMAEQRQNGRTDPETLIDSWKIEPDKPLDVEDLIGASPHPLDEVSRRSRPRQAAYRALRGATERYVAIERSGGWPRIQTASILKPGSRGPAVVTLRRRLAAEDDAADHAAGSDRFDRTLRQAVMRFQERYGLEPDGVVGGDDRAALNVSVEDRIRQMQTNLERYRWLPDTWEDERIEVNIPDYTLRAYRRGRQEIRMAVVVGRRLNQTPVFRDRMTYLVFRPCWNIPASIATDEILPHLEDDPGYLEEKQYELVGADGDVTLARFRTGRMRTVVVGSPPGTPDENAPVRHASRRSGDLPLLDAQAIRSGRLKMRQRPGAGNALGRIKFMLPNEFGIYLHDTPEDQLFDRTQRDFSHGCIRVEEPVALAAWVLDDPVNWTPAMIGQEMEKDEPPRKVSLPDGIPVYIVYLTAWVDDGGEVQFRDDIYGIDAKQSGPQPDGTTTNESVTRCRATIQSLHEAFR